MTFGWSKASQPVAPVGPLQQRISDTLDRYGYVCIDFASNGTKVVYAGVNLPSVEESDRAAGAHDDFDIILQRGLEANGMGFIEFLGL